MCFNLIIIETKRKNLFAYAGFVHWNMVNFTRSTRIDVCIRQRGTSILLHFGKLNKSRENMAAKMAHLHEGLTIIFVLFWIIKSNWNFDFWTHVNRQNYAHNLNNGEMIGKTFPLVVVSCVRQIMNWLSNQKSRFEYSADLAKRERNRFDFPETIERWCFGFINQRTQKQISVRNFERT